MEKNKLQKDLKFSHLQIQDLEVLASPESFYEFILHNLKNSRIACMACLVIGADKLCRQILEEIRNRIDSNKPTIFFVDYSRNARNNSLISCLKQMNILSKVIFVDMRTCRAFPDILNEFISVFHQKAYIFDDRVCISGANLDESYFIDRSDRYFAINSSALASTVYNSVFKGCHKMIDYNKNKILPNLHLDSLYPPGMAQPRLSMKDTHRQLSFLKNPSSFFGEEQKTIMLEFSEHNEVLVLEKLLGSTYSELAIASAYVNFPRKHLNLLKKVDFKLFTPSPSANTFNNFNTLGNYITAIYAYSNYKTACLLPNCTLYEYCKPNESFHQKGLWILNDTYAVTIIGSTNFNCRSNNFDKENNWIVASNNPVLIAKFKAEIVQLEESSQKRSRTHLAKRRVPIIILILYYVFNLFL
ncbi:CDP-diacylglycerol---glycerol-3-phosphate 3-phosphatidyltransferase [Enteropsectra breve]|nr:CDP-diacylglycerol---glycerol-3-phosphate 3-phosphatidyltransferase [Enteropsectra breve]